MSGFHHFANSIADDLPELDSGDFLDNLFPTGVQLPMDFADLPDDSFGANININQDPNLVLDGTFDDNFLLDNSLTPGNEPATHFANPSAFQGLNFLGGFGPSLLDGERRDVPLNYGPPANPVLPEALFGPSPFGPSMSAEVSNGTLIPLEPLATAKNDQIEQEEHAVSIAGEPLGQSPSEPQASTNKYPPYSGKFKTREEAKAHRRKSKSKVTKDRNLARVKARRNHWVERIYEAIVDTSVATDNASSVHLKRIQNGEFDALDIEAAAHDVFDMAVSVHEDGWTLPTVYLDEKKRGKLVDKHKNDCEGRLRTLCDGLRKHKAACNDAIQGGHTIRHLVYNPILRFSTIEDNRRNNGLVQKVKKNGPGTQGSKGPSKESSSEPGSASE